MPVPLLLDVDPGIDDALAILYAARHPGAQLLGITCVAGNVPVEIGVQNACRILGVAGVTDVPVYKGASKPLERELVTAQDTHGDNGLGEAEAPLPELPVPQDGAVDFIRETLATATERVTLLALGPLTNIAKLLETDADLVGEKAKLIIMGGAAKSHGNCSPLAEFNFWVDPHAAKAVFAQLEDITLIPLDVTRAIVLTPDRRELALRLGGPIGEFIHAITRFYVDFHWEQERTLGCVINDPLAVALALDPTLGKSELYHVDVLTEGYSMGQSVVDFASFHRKAPNTEIYLEVDPEQFFLSFFATLFPDQESDWRKILTTRPPFSVIRP